MELKVIFYIAIKNLLQRSKRSLITISGLSIAIAIVVIFVALGYGLENLVIKSFTTTDALKTIDVTAEKSEQIVIDDKTLEDFLLLDNVDNVYPITEIGAKIYFQESTTDVAVIALPGETFRYWNTLKLKEGNLDQFSGNVIILGRNTVNLLNIAEDKLEDKVELELSLSIFSDKIDSIKDEFTVIDYEINSKSPIVLIPMSYAREKGVERYSIVKVVVKNMDTISDTRLILERMGYKTRTASDTINQIGDIFAIIRIGFAAFGLIAAFVASLGMFNTLTVSHLEKTREIGIMKALGAQSDVVLKLFLAEALIMSVSGGLLGIFGGVLLSKIIQIFLSIIASSRNYHMDNLFFYFPSFLLTVLLGSGFIGILTGIYPSYKASKTNTLDALRYE